MEQENDDGGNNHATTNHDKNASLDDAHALKQENDDNNNDNSSNPEPEAAAAVASEPEGPEPEPTQVTNTTNDTRRTRRTSQRPTRYKEDNADARTTTNDSDSRGAHPGQMSVPRGLRTGLEYRSAQGNRRASSRVHSRTAAAAAAAASQQPAVSGDSTTPSVRADTVRNIQSKKRRAPPPGSAQAAAAASAQRPLKRHAPPPPPPTAGGGGLTALDSLMMLAEAITNTEVDGVSPEPLPPPPPPPSSGKRKRKSSLLPPAPGSLSPVVFPHNLVNAAAAAAAAAASVVTRGKGRHAKGKNMPHRMGLGHPLDALDSMTTHGGATHDVRAALAARRAAAAAANPTGYPPPPPSQPLAPLQSVFTPPPVTRNINRVRRWCQFEWFYAAMDRPWFLKCDWSNFLSHTGIMHATKITKMERCQLRAAFGKPRRLSLTFLKEQRQKLEAHREECRRRYRDNAELGHLPHPLAVGQRVTARHPRAQSLATGQVLTVDWNRRHAPIWVRFDSQELGCEHISDVNVMPIDALDNLPTAHKSKLLFSADGLGQQPSGGHVFPAAAQRAAQHGFGSETSIEERAATLLAATAAAVKQGALPLQNPVLTAQMVKAAAEVQSREADVRALVTLGIALDKKEEQLRLVREMNDFAEELYDRMNPAPAPAPSSASPPSERKAAAAAAAAAGADGSPAQPQTPTLSREELAKLEVQKARIAQCLPAAVIELRRRNQQVEQALTGMYARAKQGNPLAMPAEASWGYQRHILEEGMMAAASGAQATRAALSSGGKVNQAALAAAMAAIAARAGAAVPVSSSQAPPSSSSLPPHVLARQESSAMARGSAAAAAAAASPASTEPNAAAIAASSMAFAAGSSMRLLSTMPSHSDIDAYSVQFAQGLMKRAISTVVGNAAEMGRRVQINRQSADAMAAPMSTVVDGPSSPVVLADPPKPIETIGGGGGGGGDVEKSPQRSPKMLMSDLLGPAAPRVTAMLRNALALLVSAQACADNDMSSSEVERTVEMSLSRIAPQKGRGVVREKRDAVRTNAEALKSHLCSTTSDI
ncbi:DIRP domain-containing protein [Pycnococcus provasolii]